MSPAAHRPPEDDELRELTAQEDRLVLHTFSNEDAWRLGSLLVSLAQERGAAVTIGIRRGTQQLFHYALPGTSADNDAWIARKSAVVERYAESSYLVGARFRAKGRTFEDSSRLNLTTTPPTAAPSRSACAAQASSGWSRSPACPRPTTMRWWWRGWSDTWQRADAEAGRGPPRHPPPPHAPLSSCRCRPSPSISSSTTSPARRYGLGSGWPRATPDGVPVLMMSPG